MMKKIVVASLGLASLLASPLAAQTAGQMTHDQLMKWASDGGYCGSMAVVDAKYLADGRVQVTCPSGYKPGQGTGAGAGGATLTGGLAGSGGAVAGIIGVVVVAAAAGSGGGSSTGSTVGTNS